MYLFGGMTTLKSVVHVVVVVQLKNNNKCVLLLKLTSLSQTHAVMHIQTYMAFMVIIKGFSVTYLVTCTRQIDCQRTQVSSLSAIFVTAMHINLCIKQFIYRNNVVVRERKID